MKPTRHIVKPNSRLWKAKQRVWYQKNDDLGMNNTAGKIPISLYMHDIEKQNDRMASKQASNNITGITKNLRDQEIHERMEKLRRDIKRRK